MGDLIRGDWTWFALGREVLPLVMVGVAAFAAGYAKGWNAGVHYAENYMTRFLFGDESGE